MSPVGQGVFNSYRTSGVNMKLHFTVIFLKRLRIIILIVVYFKNGENK